MSASAELQRIIWERLTTDPTITTLVGDRVYDGPQSGAAHPYISFGNADVVEDDADCIVGRDETFQIDVWSELHNRKIEAKRINDAVRTSLHNYTADMGDYALHSMRVVLSQIMPDPDGISTHGVVQVTALIENG